MFTVKDELRTAPFALGLSLLNLLLFHWPFFSFVFHDFEELNVNSGLVMISLLMLMVAVNFLFFYLLLTLSRRFGKILLILVFILNAAAVYFVNAYSIIIDGIMMSNLFHTDVEESGSFISVKLFVYILLLGVVPSLFIARAKLVKSSAKIFFLITVITFSFIAIIVFANARNWLWIDKNSVKLGALAMPWSYSVNSSIMMMREYEKNKKEILLPNATIKDNQKSIVVLVIGESSRSKNFSLYGYQNNTNPLLSQTKNLYHFNATSFSTYTTAGIKAILEHTHTDELYEILPNYLYRNKVDVIWRSTNWGEPPIHIKNYQDKNALMENCKGDSCEYDEILLKGLTEQIKSGNSNKVFVVLHTSTSHGPIYSKKYPPSFETFKPVCNSVDLGKCSQQELINAYDNTIVYTDYLLHRVIEELKQLPEYNSCMFFVSDHGESLGENNLYMHGLPRSMAPKEQYEIPFLVWLSDSSHVQLKSIPEVTQNNVFHSVLHFLGMQSPVYDEKMDIFK